VAGQEHVENNPYDNYFASDSGFRDLAARDQRLGTKEPIYSFQIGAGKYAVPFSAFEGGAVVRAGGRAVFLYRPADVAVFYSTLAFQGAEGAFERREGAWHHVPSGARLDTGAASFGGAERLDGFDTYWYMWSLTHPDTEVLKPAVR
jgi:hypothetical protein